MESFRNAKLTVDGKTYSGNGELGKYVRSNNDNSERQTGVFITRETALPDDHQEAEGGDGPSMQFKDVVKGGALAEFEGYQFESINEYRATVYVESSHPIGNTNLHQVTFTVQGEKNRITD